MFWKLFQFRFDLCSAWFSLRALALALSEYCGARVMYLEHATQYELGVFWGGRIRSVMVAVARAWWALSGGTGESIRTKSLCAALAVPDPVGGQFPDLLRRGGEDA